MIRGALFDAAERGSPEQATEMSKPMASSVRVVSALSSPTPARTTSPVVTDSP